MYASGSTIKPYKLKEKTQKIVIYTQDEVYIEKCVMSIIIVLLIRKKTSKRRTGCALVDLTG